MLLPDQQHALSKKCFSEVQKVKSKQAEDVSESFLWAECNLQVNSAVSELAAICQASGNS